MLYVIIKGETLTGMFAFYIMSSVIKLTTTFNNVGALRLEFPTAAFVSF